LNALAGYCPLVGMKKEDTPPADDAPEIPAELPTKPEPTVGVPAWLNLSGTMPHAIVAVLLLLGLLLGYALPYEAPKLEKNDYPTLPRNPTEKQRAEFTEERKRIEKLNDDARESFNTSLKEWNDGGEESRRKLIAFGRNTARMIAVVWFIFIALRLGIGPLVRFVPKHFGKDLAVVILPVIMLGVFFALATLLVKWIPESGWPMPNALDLKDQSIWRAVGQFFVHLLHPVAETILTLKEYCFDKWFVPGILVVTTAILGWQRVVKQQAEKG